LKRDELTSALGRQMPSALADDLVENFLQLRQDVATGTLGRANAGKFVETVVQILQYMECGRYEPKPDVDGFLRGLESRSSSLDDGLRICASRVARAMYSLRSKRNVVHKGEIDPNHYDLAFLHHGAQWVVAELIRTVTGTTMEEAGRLVEMVQAPAGGLVEDFGDKKLVVEQMTARDEALILLHRVYPEAVSLADLRCHMNRCAPGTVRNTLRAMWADRLVEGDPNGYRLTRPGYGRAIAAYKRYI